MKPSGIGGQAVMEGVMMKNGSRYAVAVRKADQSIEVKKEEYHSISDICSFFRVPLIRGIVNFIEMFYLGMKTLLYSASFYEEEETKRKQEWEEWISTGTGRNFTGDLKRKKHIGGLGSKIKSIFNKIMTIFFILCSIVIAVALFMLLPMFLSEKLLGLEASMEKAVLEGVLRLLIFFLYLLAASRVEDMKRLFMYHGAEHKVINCIENGLELTIENVRKESRQHKRCGTSFLFLVVFLSIIFFLFIKTDILWQKIVFRILLVPVIAAISYEFIRLAGKSENPIVNILSKPGLWFQFLTTREPEDDMILVAIQSVEAVFDWREFLQENFGRSITWKPLDDKKRNQDDTIEEKMAASKTFSMMAKERLQETILNDEEKNNKELKEQNDNIGKEKKEKKEKEKKEEIKQEQKEQELQENTSYARLQPDIEHEDDPILKALDKFFGE